MDDKNPRRKRKREAQEELVWRFRELSDRHAGWTVFYQVSAERLPLYIDLGLAVMKLGEEAHVVPGEGAALQVWILGSSGGESAEVAGHGGLRFAANYHVSPATVLEAVDGYRAAFHASAELDRPYVSVSADVVVADTEAQARELAAGYGPWVRSIRTAEGAIQFPTPEQARRYQWTDADRALVADRVDTQFAGTPRQVADQLERLRDATEADELIITTITHDHADRVASYQLLADEWARR